MGKVAGRFVIILNIHNVLSIEEINMLTEVTDLRRDPLVPG
jgi:hypothetical protein